MIHQRNEQGVQTNHRGELPLLQLFDKAGDVTRVADQHVVVAGNHHAHAVNGEGKDVVQRQRRDDDLARLARNFLTFAIDLLHVGVHLQHVGDQVAVGQHGALGNASGAAGVLQHGHVFQGAGHGCRALALAAFERSLERNGLGQRVARHHLFDVLDRCVDQRALEARQHVAQTRFKEKLDFSIGEHFFDQVAEHVHEDQRTGAGVLELVPHFAGGVQRVGVDHHQTGANGTKYRNGELQHVGHLDGDAVTRLQRSVLLQIGSKGSGVTIQVGVGKRDTHVAEGRPLSVFDTGLIEDIDN